MNEQESVISKEKQQEILKKYSSESNYREFDSKFWFYVVAVVAIGLSLFHLYTSGFGLLLAIKQRSIHLGAVLFLVFLLYPANKKRSPMGKPTVFDVLFALLSAITCGYLVFFFENIAMRAGMANSTDIILGTMLMLLVLEAARRTMGMILPVLAITCVFYAMCGEWIPGVFGHMNFTYPRIIEQMYISTEGIFSIALGVSAQYIFLFVLFGSFMAASGMGRLINDGSMALAGKSPGGPAKVAILGSSIMATINGAAVANVVTTGAFTIPLMKKIGYKPRFAGAVEATSSCGGQIMPPVMGAAAFVLAELTGIPYGTVMIAAIVPALLYYLAVWTMVDREARRLELQGLNMSDIPRLKDVLKARGHMLFPLLVIVAILVNGFSAMYAAFYGLLSTLLVASLRKETRMTLSQIVNAMIVGGRTALAVAVACAVVGFVIGVVSLTSVGVVFTDSILSFTDGMLVPTLILTMLACIILGMGLPTTPAYIMAATIAVPALIALGVDALAANLFVFYYAILSTLTPPVAIAAYAAAGLAGAPVFSTGWAALRLAMGGFIIPYMFVLEPALLIVRGSPVETLLGVVPAILGVILLGCAVIGYFRVNCNAFERIVLFIGAFALIIPELATDLTGLAVTVLVYLLQSRRMMGGKSVGQNGM
ncbi:TRAP transporter, 4TM/12TM fusion protein [Desulfotomaculum arcticum]|uniref:TRAP transporter, 4TM/12TM fusion protein n=1 Tax=Desulfotruncus arcticus DSM 17038 TaxID=1121424 RepID=A0A1I2YRN3_9FIRM|nr:TRAP transporter permease [Desulfotruncus arcticus]SFH27281.1 TRAP transporter, 4TM/12TM fusion protein [Desulfotomaculum arcticum] [Desulfotruncus arcticus DSM 17038]